MKSQTILRRGRSSVASLEGLEKDRKHGCPPPVAVTASSSLRARIVAPSTGTSSTEPPLLVRSSPPPLLSLLGFVLVGWFLCYGYVSSSDQSVHFTNHSTSTIAYAVSLIKCGDGKQNAAAGLTEAALVLRHSIHHISRRNKQSGSKYDYKLYALVHRQAAECSQPLADAGYEIRIVDPPVVQEEIQGEYLRKTIHKEVCCGVDEFVKLHSYSLPEEISVHVDIDFIFLKPMDELFDAILYGPESPKGQQARKHLVDQGLVENFTGNTMPSGQIDAFLVRDWFSTFPGRKSPYQAGFIVARRDPSIVTQAAEIVRQGNFTEGFSPNNGWGGEGYGGFVGARAMQGLMAYYYDIIRPNTHVELDSCRVNHIGAHLNGQKGCKTGQTNKKDCPDCRKTPLDQIYSIHYTVCRKPWNCVAEAVPGGRTPGAKYGDALDTTVGDVEHCLQATEIWHKHRADLERRLFKHLSSPSAVSTRTQRALQPQQQLPALSESGEYRREHFLGHCVGEKKYLPMKLVQHLATTTVIEDVYNAPYSEEPLAYMPS